MRKIAIILFLLMTTVPFMTCERNDMHDLALLGLAPKNAIYLYIGGMSSGNSKGRNDSDSQCYTAGLIYHSLIGASRVKAFRSYSFSDELRFIVPTNYWQYPVVGISPALTLTMVSSTWASLWDGALDNPVNTSVGMPSGTYWWSGSNPDGGYSGIDCGGWQDSISTKSGQVGGAGIGEATLTCDTSNYVLCVAY
ncbi:MAG: hypothetical protein KA369_08065 [Spirochaetes bacterium]|nr:hypothetical protein [Spirochaetota bacterium]